MQNLREIKHDTTTQSINSIPFADFKENCQSFLIDRAKFDGASAGELTGGTDRESLLKFCTCFTKRSTFTDQIED